MKKRAYRMDNTIIHRLLCILQTAAWSERGGCVKKLAEDASQSR